MQAKITTSAIEAAKYLIEGQNVAIPTETVYGLAGNAYNEQAVLNIFAIKNRPKFDPLIVHTHSIEQIERFVKSLPAVSKSLLESFSPGPLTVVLHKRDHISDLVTSGLPNVAVRIPNHPLTLELLRQLDFPVAAPSANPFTYVSPTSAEHVNQQLGRKIPCILNGGPCQVGIESTIIREADDKVWVLRLGGLDIDELQAKSNKPVELAKTVEEASPGNFSKHYATKTPLYMGLELSQIPVEQAENVAYLRFSDYKPEVEKSKQIILAPDGQITTAAKNLFSILRELDQSSFSAIIGEWIPETGLGPAINDRLRRASINC
ncbi:MAG: threonylcarbamoyl-AMP synthase [Bacteroidetes bacterium]|nr:threonylcarbamoyl-AMP synthase [Bacteroidota bacterium]